MQGTSHVLMGHKSNQCHAVLLRHEPPLQRHHVGSVHSRSHTGDQYGARQCHEHECEFYAHGCAGVVHFP